MAETPNKDIERLLSEYAGERRSAAGTPELHPATRRMLQSEVKRQFPSEGQTNTKPVPSRWSILWPRIALACGVMAAAAVVVLIIQPPGDGSEHMEMAMSDAPAAAQAQPAAPAESSPAPTPTLAASGARPASAPVATKGASGFSGGGGLQVAGGPELASSGAQVNSRSRANPGKAAEAADAAASVQQRAELTAAGDSAGGARNLAGASSSTQTLLATADRQVDQNSPGADDSNAPAMSRMSKSAEPSTAAQAAQLLNNSLTQQYRNINFADSREQTPAQSVLNEFTVEQNGNELKVVDGDGSVYKGYVEAAPPESAITNLASIAQALQEAEARTDVAVPSAAFQGGPATAMMPSPNLARGGQGGFGGGGGRGGGGGNTAQSPAFNETQNYYFRVEGTNRRLQQRVVFTGNMIQNGDLNSLPNNTANVQYYQQNQIQQATPSNSFNLQMQYNYINGRFTLDDGRVSTEMNAVQVGP